MKLHELTLCAMLIGTECFELTNAPAKHSREILETAGFPVYKYNDTGEITRVEGNIRDLIRDQDITLLFHGRNNGSKNFANQMKDVDLDASSTYFVDGSIPTEGVLESNNYVPLTIYENGSTCQSRWHYYSDVGEKINQQLGLEDANEVTIIGYSMGGAVAAGVACAASKVKKVVVISATPAIQDCDGDGKELTLCYGSRDRQWASPQDIKNTIDGAQTSGFIVNQSIDNGGHSLNPDRLECVKDAISR